MTWVTPTATSLSEGVPATKFGIAIGSGWNSPSGTIMRFGAWPKACRTSLPANPPSEAMPEMICRRLRGNGIARNPFLSLSVIGKVSFHVCDRKWRPASSFSFGEYRREIFPFLEKCRRQIIWLTLDDRAQGALLIDAKIGRRRRAFGHRHSLQRTIALQAD